MFRRILHAIRRISERRRISKRLMALDDHELQDLGVPRDQIAAYVSAALREDGAPAA